MIYAPHSEYTSGKVAAGANEAYDQVPSQNQLFYTGVHNGSTNGDVSIPPPPPLGAPPETSVPVVAAAAAAIPVDSRSYLPVEQRPLRTVSEIPHDSEIDTELESDGEDDATSVPPPPPPMAFHPSYGEQLGRQAQSPLSDDPVDDEMSI